MPLNQMSLSLKRDARVLRHRGLSYYVQDSLPPAEHDFLEAIRLAPDDADARSGLALVRVRQEIQGEEVNRLQEAADELASATVPLAELQMNAVVRSTLQGKVMEEVKPEKL